MYFGIGTLNRNREIPSSRALPVIAMLSRSRSPPAPQSFPPRPFPAKDLKNFRLATRDAKCPDSTMKPGPDDGFADEWLTNLTRSRIDLIDILDSKRPVHLASPARKYHNPCIIVTYRDTRTVLVDDGASGEPRRDRQILTPVRANRAGSVHCRHGSPDRHHGRAEP